MIKYLLAYALAGACLYAQAQDNIKPLTIGDAVPDITFNNLINYPTKTAKLSDFKGKLVILDFWATWCGSCIRHIPDMEVLQNEFKNEIKVLLVNSSATDNRKTVEQFLLRRKSQKRPITLTVTSEDTMAAKLFAHNSIPHYAWINSKGVVAAITGIEDVTPENIRKAIDESGMAVRTKRDMDTRKKIYLKEDVPIEQLRHYAIFFKGKLFDLNGGGGVVVPRMESGAYDGILIGNTPLYQIYTSLASEILKDYNNDPARFIIKPADTAGLYFRNYHDTRHSMEWAAKNVVTLDLYAPSKSRRELFLKVLEELNHYSDYKAEIKPVLTTSYVLKRKEGVYRQDLAPGQGGTKSLKGIWDLKSLIIKLRKESIPVVDHTGAATITNIQLPDHIKSIEELVPVLAAQGLLLEKEAINLPMFFITKK